MAYDYLALSKNLDIHDSNSSLATSFQIITYIFYGISDRFTDLCK